MKSITLLTSTKIISTKVSAKILEKFPKNINIVQNDEKELYVGKNMCSFNIVFDFCDNVKSENSIYDEEFIKLIPFEPAFFTVLNFHSEINAKLVVSAILESYPELVVYDDQTDWMGSAIDYIK